MIQKGILLVLAFLAFKSAAGTEPLSLNWRLYAAADGLGENACVSVAVSPRDKVWVQHPRSGTFSVLDGYNVTNVAAPGGFVSRVYEGPGDHLWTLCEDGLMRFRDGSWLRFAVPEIASAFGSGNPRGPDSVPLYPVRIGRVLFLLSDSLMELDVDSENRPRTTTLRSADKARLGEFLGMIASARGGRLWLACERGLARSVDAARGLKLDAAWEEYSLPASLGLKNLRSPVEDEDGGVIAVAQTLDGSQKVVVRFDGSQWRTNSVGRENARFAWRGPDRTLWMATTNALFQWDDGQKEFVPNEEISARHYLDVAAEPNGNFWLATSEGLFRHCPPAWRIPSYLQSLNTAVQSMTEDRDGRLWAVSGRSLFVIQTNQVRNHPLPEGFSRDNPGPFVVFSAGDNAIAAGAGDRIVEFKPASGGFAEITAPSRTSHRLIGTLPDGSLCVQSSSQEPGTDAIRLKVLDGADLVDFPYPQPPPNLGSELLLHSSARGDIWLGGAKGIARFRDQKWQMFSPAEESLPEGISCLIEFTGDKIWCGAQDKIWECDGKTWRLVWGGFGRVNALLRARDDSVWAASDNGLRRYFRGVWCANTAEEGLPAGPVRCIQEDRAGKIWVGTSRGLSLYHPDADLDPPFTYVESATGPVEPILEGSPVNLSFHARDKWKFTPDPLLLYSYRLDEQEWTPYQEQRSVSLADLSAGKHYFQVRSMDRNWNEDKRLNLVEFAVVLPWYKESRLILISAGGVMVAFFFAALAFNRHLRLKRSYAEVEAQVALRTKQLEVAGQELLHSQKMNALGTLAAGIAHDFNNILSIIKGSAQIIEDNLENQDKVRVRTDRIKTVVEQGAGIVQAMLGFSRGSGGELTMCDVNAVVQDTIKLLGDRFLREVEVQFEPTPSLPQAPASRDFIQQILLNLIFNAAEAMTDKRQVILSTRQGAKLPDVLALPPTHTANYVFISVKDFGAGIPPEIMSRIFEPFFTTKSLSARRGTGLGLSMVYELSRQMETGVAVESLLGQGSQFTLIIPVRELPLDARAQMK